MMNVRPIRSEADYDWALGELEAYFAAEPRPGSPAADRFDVLSALVGAYEDERWSIDAPDPVSAIRHWMELHGLSQSDLTKILGSRSRASEVLNRKRPLTLTMAFALHQQWKMPAEILIRPSPRSMAA